MTDTFLPPLPLPQGWVTALRAEAEALHRDADRGPLPPLPLLQRWVMALQLERDISQGIFGDGT